MNDRGQGGEDQVMEAGVGLMHCGYKGRDLGVSGILAPGNSVLIPFSLEPRNLYYIPPSLSTPPQAHHPFPHDFSHCLCYRSAMNRGRTFLLDLSEIPFGLTDLFAPVSGLDSAVLCNAQNMGGWIE